MTKKTGSKQLNPEQLENVSGGTVKEYSELLEARNEINCVGRGVASHVPLINHATAYDLENTLKAYDVDAEINLGFAGLGIGSDPNTYRDSVTGETLTHEQVLNRLRRVIHYN